MNFLVPRIQDGDAVAEGGRGDCRPDEVGGGLTASRALDRGWERRFTPSSLRPQPPPRLPATPREARSFCAAVIASGACGRYSSLGAGWFPRGTGPGCAVGRGVRGRGVVRWRGPALPGPGSVFVFVYVWTPRPASSRNAPWPGTWRPRITGPLSSRSPASSAAGRALQGPAARHLRRTLGPVFFPSFRSSGVIVTGDSGGTNASISMDSLEELLNSKLRTGRRLFATFGEEESS
ncbi:uncharacterized protein LOC106698264 [Myotis lucifugus]|uniref:uncharacterized protein LOC106698264 n=1 Tax=Myotis lucifugus TaxID=59463 RepID=UPI0006D7412D|nr:uncharacterized protein LOC106698264 [Myotis lucifugus]